MTKIALLGYGQMGKLIEKLAKKENCVVVAKIDPKLGTNLTKKALGDAEVVIDFSLGKTVIENAKFVSSIGKKMVIGATGWDKKKLLEIKNSSIVYGSNFSIGMNIFYEIIRKSAKKFNEVLQYDVCGVEYHHKRKIDSPSGSAKVLSDIIMQEMERKSMLCTESINRKIKPLELHFASVRCGDIPGRHSINFESPFDTIELIHTARNREGFAIGALKAANFIQNRTGIYEFSEVFKKIIRA